MRFRFFFSSVSEATPFFLENARALSQLTIMYSFLFTLPITFCEASVTTLTVRSTACVWQGSKWEFYSNIAIKFRVSKFFA